MTTTSRTGLPVRGLVDFRQWRYRANRQLWEVAVLAVLLLGAAMLMPMAHPVVDYHEWRSEAEFAAGVSEGLRPTPGGLVVCRPIGQANGYDYARWTSPTRTTAFSATQIVASWNADTPTGTWIEVDLRGLDTGWYVMGR